MQYSRNPLYFAFSSSNKSNTVDNNEKKRMSKIPLNRAHIYQYFVGITDKRARCEIYRIAYNLETNREKKVTIRPKMGYRCSAIIRELEMNLATFDSLSLRILSKWVDTIDGYDYSLTSKIVNHSLWITTLLQLIIYFYIMIGVKIWNKKRILTPSCRICGMRPNIVIS